MNKKHRKAIDLRAELASGLVEGWLDDSYAQVLKGFPKELQAKLTAKPAARPRFSGQKKSPQGGLVLCARKNQLALTAGAVK